MIMEKCSWVTSFTQSDPRSFSALAGLWLGASLEEILSSPCELKSKKEAFNQETDTFFHWNKLKHKLKQLQAAATCFATPQKGSVLTALQKLWVWKDLEALSQTICSELTSELEIPHGVTRWVSKMQIWRLYNLLGPCSSAEPLALQGTFSFCPGRISYIVPFASCPFAEHLWEHPGSITSGRSSGRWGEQMWCQLILYSSGIDVWRCFSSAHCSASENAFQKEITSVPGPF